MAERTLASFEAQQQTRQRQQRQADDGILLVTAREALRAALLQRWQQPASRQQWCEELVNVAATTLDGKVWTVEHPADWPMSEHDALREQIHSLCGKTPRLEANADISAGLRICAAGTCTMPPSTACCRIDALMRNCWRCVPSVAGENMSNVADSHQQRADATITWISGPVLRASVARPFSINEAALVGEQQLLGEVIRLDGPYAVIQVYEDTTGLRPGDIISGTGTALSVPLGPGLLGNIFDGLLRPLTVQGQYVAPGISNSLDTNKWPFRPRARVGEQLAAGQLIGVVKRDDARLQHCLVPPGVSGTVIDIVQTGHYPGDVPVCVLRDEEGVEHPVCMVQPWPVRKPRPVAARMPVEGPLFTGQRILDSIFPLACGGRAAMPGGFGTGKTVLQQTLAKWCEAEVIVYVGCGERGNEMAGVLHEFPALEDPRTGRPLMERTVIIANTSNMPVAAREASIYTAVTVGEYFRDQGLRVALMADSTSRWAEALREVSGRLGELPGEAGYPAYLSSRQADFYERAAHVATLSGARRRSVLSVRSVRRRLIFRSR